MPRFLTNPGSLTKDRLKSELTSNGVALPKGDQRKKVYVDLYLEHLTSQNEHDGDDDARMFSSDEEDLDDSKTSPKKPPPSRTKHLIRKPVKGLPYDVNALSDGDLARQLRNYGQVVGPITDTTRPLYQKKLIKILQEEMKNPETFQEQLKPPLQQSAPKAWEFSDNEEEEEVQPSKPVSASRSAKKKDEEVVMIEDKIDAKPVPQDVTPPKERTPKVTRTETIVSESYVETRKRVVANNKTVDSELKSQKLSVPVNKPPENNMKELEGNSWEWKAILVFLALTTTILLVYYFMEGSPSAPRLDKDAQ